MSLHRPHPFNTLPLSVAALSHLNLMKTSNLGVCFGPTLMRPRVETVATIADLKHHNKVVEVLIENVSQVCVGQVCGSRCVWEQVCGSRCVGAGVCGAGVWEQCVGQVCVGQVCGAGVGQVCVGAGMCGAGVWEQCVGQVCVGAGVWE